MAKSNEKVDNRWHGSLCEAAAAGAIERLQSLITENGGRHLGAVSPIFQATALGIAAIYGRTDASTLWQAAGG